MSTKIYTGFRLRSPSWRDAHANIAAFRAEVEEAYHAIDCRVVSAFVCRAIDEAAINSEPPPDGLYVDALMKLTELRSKTVPTFDIVLFPYGRLIYGMTFGDWHHCESWASKPHVERWPYWNNTDRPEDVTAREWRRRSKTWDAILGGDGYASPAECGFVAQCLPRYPRLPRHQSVIPLIPSLADRALAQANTAILATRYAITKESSEDDRYRASKEAREWIKTEEGKSIQAGEIARITPLLSPKITPKSLGVGPARTTKGGAR